MLAIPATCIEWGVNHKYVSLHDRENVSKVILYSESRFLILVNLKQLHSTLKFI